MRKCMSVRPTASSDRTLYTHRKCMSVRLTASSDRTLYTHGKCMSVRLTAGMLRARERVWRSLRTPQQSLWMGGLGDFLHLVAGAISCGTPLLRGRLVGLAVAEVTTGNSFVFLALSSM